MSRDFRHLSVSIGCPVSRAYAWLSVPENFPHWASGLATSLRKENGEWIAETPFGAMKIVFSPPNEFGVLDHWVHTPEGGEIYVPLRVVANGKGCELILTLFRQPDMSDERFAADAKLVRKDLQFAKKILESGPGGRE